MTVETQLPRCHFQSCPATSQLTQCTNCMSAMYCSKEHQQSDLNTHLSFCLITQKLMDLYSHRLQFIIDDPSSFIEQVIRMKGDSMGDVIKILNAFVNLHFNGTEIPDGDLEYEPECDIMKAWEMDFNQEQQLSPSSCWVNVDQANSPTADAKNFDVVLQDIEVLEKSAQATAYIQDHRIDLGNKIRAEFKEEMHRVESLVRQVKSDAEHIQATWNLIELLESQKAGPAERIFALWNPNGVKCSGDLNLRGLKPLEVEYIIKCHLIDSRADLMQAGWSKIFIITGTLETNQVPRIVALVPKILEAEGLNVIKSTSWPYEFDVNISM